MKGLCMEPHGLSLLCSVGTFTVSVYILIIISHHVLGPIILALPAGHIMLLYRDSIVLEH